MGKLTFIPILAVTILLKWSAQFSLVSGWVDVRICLLFVDLLLVLTEDLGSILGIAAPISKRLTDWTIQLAIIHRGGGHGAPREGRDHGRRGAAWAAHNAGVVAVPRLVWLQTTCGTDAACSVSELVLLWRIRGLLLMLTLVHVGHVACDFAGLHVHQCHRRTSHVAVDSVLKWRKNILVKVTADKIYKIMIFLTQSFPPVCYAKFQHGFQNDQQVSTLCWLCKQKPFEKHNWH